jgi:multidrug efflux pump subunit AcrA (membrane-fusion protein)
VKNVAVLALTMIVLVSLRGQDLPRSSEPDPLEIEPPILPGNLVPEESAKSRPPTDLTQLEHKLVRAKENAAGAERLFKIGVLAKLEAENQAIRVVKLEAELAQARATAAQLDLDHKQQQFTAQEIARTELDLAQTQLTESKRAAEIAATNQKRAELDAAAINLARQQKLLALGSGGKSAVRRAEEKLAALKGTSQ